MTHATSSPSPPQFLVQVLCPDSGGTPRPHGSGMLLAEGWLLTARHVVQGFVTLKDRSRRWADLVPNLCIERDGARVPIALPGDPSELICDPTGADVALVPLSQPVAGPFATLSMGIRRPEPGHALGYQVTAWGFAGSLAAGAEPVHRGWILTGPEITWHDGNLLDIQLDGGMHKGASGGALCIALDGRQLVLAMLYLGEEGAATTRAIAVPRLLPLLRGRAGLDLDGLLHERRSRKHPARGQHGEPENPYDPWHPALPPAFVGRERILRKLEAASIEGSGVSLVGDYRTGKTSILASFERHARDLGIPVRLLSGEGGAAADHRRFVAAALGGPPVGMEPDDIPQSADAAADRLDAWCREIGPADSGRPTILLDEAAAFLERCERRFLERLRAMLGASRLALVFATHATLDVIRDDQGRTSPFANLMDLERVGLLEAGDARAIIERGAALWQGDDRDWLIDWAGHHAFYLTLLACNLSEARRDGGQRDDALDRFRDKVGVQLNRVWRHLGERDREELRRAARGQRVERNSLRMRGLVTADGQPFARVLGEWLNEME